MIFRVHIPGEPTPQNQGVVGRWKAKDGREGITIRQPVKVTHYKLEAQERIARAAEAMGWNRDGAPLFGDGPVLLSILAIFSCPKHLYRKREPTPRRPHTGRYGNVDNLTKLLADVAEGILWADDGQITCLLVQKLWGAQGEPPFVEIKATEYDSLHLLGIVKGVAS